MKKIIVHHRSNHHAINSGYARIIDYMSDVSVIDGKTFFPYRIAKMIAARTSQDAGFYVSSSVLKEIQLFSELRKDKRAHKVIHYLNAERDVRYVLSFKRNLKNASFYGTFHKTPQVLESWIQNTSYLNKLDGAIAVGVNQIEFLKNWLTIDNVKYIPHGVDTNFFVPNVLNRKENTLLFVGQHLRDFEVLNYCIPRIAEKVKNLKVHVVLRKEYVNKVQPNAVIQIWNDISDVELSCLYQEASLLFLPLLDVTACNSILEAMACGLPIVTTDVGGVSEYLKDSGNVTMPSGEIDGYVEVITNLLKDEDRLNLISHLSRKKAESYDWHIVSAKVLDFYKDTMN